MTTLAVRRLLASVTLAVLGAGIGAVGAAGSEPPDATETVSAPDSSTTTTTTLPTTTTTTIPTTVASTTTTLDRAARRRWAGTLRADVEELVAAISAVGTGSEVAESATVREMFEKAAEESARLHGLLDDVSAAADRLERHLPRAAEVGLDTQGHRKLVSAARIWEQAQRRAAQPDPCRTVLPQGAGEWAPWRLGDFQPYVDCLAREVAPLPAEGAQAGRPLTEGAAGRD